MYSNVSTLPIHHRLVFFFFFFSSHLTPSTSSLLQTLHHHHLHLMNPTTTLTPNTRHHAAATAPTCCRCCCCCCLCCCYCYLCCCCCCQSAAAVATTLLLLLLLLSSPSRPPPPPAGSLSSTPIHHRPPQQPPGRLPQQLTRPQAPWPSTDTNTPKSEPSFNHLISRGNFSILAQPIPKSSSMMSYSLERFGFYILRFKLEQLDRLVRMLVARSNGSFLRFEASGLPDDSLYSITEHAGSLETLLPPPPPPPPPRSKISDSVVEQTSATFLDVSYCKKIGRRALAAFGNSCAQVPRSPACVGRCIRWRWSQSDEEAFAIASTMRAPRNPFPDAGGSLEFLAAGK